MEVKFSEVKAGASQSQIVKYNPAPECVKGSVTSYGTELNSPVPHGHKLILAAANL